MAPNNPKPSNKPAPVGTLPASAANAMLVGVKLCAWNPAKVDTQVTAEVAANHGADVDAGRYRKQLASKADLQAVKKAASAIRAHHYDHTLPWAFADGLRLLPVANYEAYRAGLRQLKTEYLAQARSLADRWTTVLADAQQRLGTMYHSTDYPSAREVEAAYTCEHYVVPVARGSDLVANLPKGLRDQIAADIDARTKAAEVAAMGDLWARVHASVQAMAEKLPKFRPEEKGKDRGTFRDSLVDNVREICDLLPRLNVTGDAHLQRMHTEILGKLAKHDARELREDDATRSKVAADASAILEQMAGYCGGQCDTD